MVLYNSTRQASYTLSGATAVVIRVQSLTATSLSRPACLSIHPCVVTKNGNSLGRLQFFCTANHRETPLPCLLTESSENHAELERSCASGKAAHTLSPI